MICYANKLLFKILQMSVFPFIQEIFLLLKDNKINYFWQFKVTSDVIYCKTSAREFSFKRIICITYQSLKRNCIIQI